jgi:uncharacterized protein (TIGR02270 family)
VDQQNDLVDFVVREHVELAAFLWAQRDSLSTEDPPDQAALATVDARLEANLDALRVAGTAAWPLIEAAYGTYPEKGELFLFAYRAVETGDMVRIAQAVEWARSADGRGRGLDGAMEWLPPAVSAPVVRKWLDQSDPVRCRAALAALTAHKADPSTRLPDLLAHVAPEVRVAACRLTAVLNRRDMLATLRKLLTDAAIPVKQAAGLALAQMGERDADAALKADVVARTDSWQVKLRALIACTPAAQLRPWLTSLLESPDTQEIGIRAVGMLGDRRGTGWIITRMTDPGTAVAAGQAMIDLYPEVATNETLWSTDPARFSAAFTTHFGDDLPRLPLAAAMERAFGDQPGGEP